MFAAESVNTPLPPLLIPPVPVDTPPDNNTPPDPLTENAVFVPDTAPRVSCVPAFAVNTAPLADSVVAPNVNPAVPLFTFAPLATVSVCAPIDRVPSVCVTPAPAVNRSEVIVAFAETVVFRPKPNPVLFANCSAPPDSVSVPAPRAEALVVALSVPALTFAIPVNVFTPDSVSSAVPVFRIPIVPDSTALIVASALVTRSPAVMLETVPLTVGVSVPVPVSVIVPPTPVLIVYPVPLKNIPNVVTAASTAMAEVPLAWKTAMFPFTQPTAALGPPVVVAFQKSSPLPLASGCQDPLPAVNPAHLAASQ